MVYFQKRRTPASHQNNRAESTIMTILEQLWNGTLRPAETPNPPDPRYNELLTLAHETEQKLLSLLTDEGTELFCKLNDIKGELYAMDERKIFATGFSTGANLMLEITNTDE